jgi:hypothetical protein
LKACDKNEDNALRKSKNAKEMKRWNEKQEGLE